MLHRARLEWPCLSFAVVPDALGEDRAAFPHTAYFVAGTQAEARGQNRLLCLKMSAMHRTKHDDESGAQTHATPPCTPHTPWQTRRRRHLRHVPKHLRDASGARSNHVSRICRPPGRCLLENSQATPCRRQHSPDLASPRPPCHRLVVRWQMLPPAHTNASNEAPFTPPRRTSAAAPARRAEPTPRAAPAATARPALPPRCAQSCGAPP